MIEFYLYICSAFENETEMNSKSSYCNNNSRRNAISGMIRPIGNIGLVSVIIIVVVLNVIIIQ